MLTVYLNFDSNAILKRAGMTGLAKKVADLVRVLAVGLTPGEWNRFDRWGKGRRFAALFPDELRDVSIQVVDNPGFVLWGVGLGAAVPDITPERLMEAISGKDKKVADYDRSRCDELWLLLVTGGMWSSYYAMNAAVEEHEFPTRFDRVLLFENFRGQIVELRTVRP